MPTYESRCPICGTVHVYVRCIDQRDETPICCNQKTQREIVTPPMGFVDVPATGFTPSC